MYLPMPFGQLPRTAKQEDQLEMSILFLTEALLHRVPWSRGITYDAICSFYVQYVANKYGKATVVFDGYQNGPSRKDGTHQRRAGAYGPTVNFDSTMIAKLKIEEFIANKENKQKFIHLLRNKLEQSGCSTIHSEGDADLRIVQTAIQSSRSITTLLVGDDTDLLVLLCYHAEMNANELFFKSEPKQRSKTRKTWNIKRTKTSLGANVCTNILFVHAILGCDTTSRIHGIGKGVALTKIRTDALFREQANVFNHPGASKDEVIMAGEKALLCLYNCRSDKSLDSLRYTKFCQKVHRDNIGAAREPSAYIQSHWVSQSQSILPNSTVERCIAGARRLGLEVDGWKTASIITKDLPPAHESLLEMVKCNCKVHVQEAWTGVLGGLWSL